MYSAPKFSYLSNSSATSGGTAVPSSTAAMNPGYPGRLSAPPEYEQRVPGSITSLPNQHQQIRGNYGDYSGFPGTSASSSSSSTYPKHPKSYLSSTLISIPKNSSTSYYAGTPVVQEFAHHNHHHPHRHSFDNSTLQANATAFVPPKFLDTKSLQKMHCFPKQRFTPYTGRLTQPPPIPHSSRYSLVPDVQQVPCSTSTSCCSSSSGYAGSHNLNGSLNASASSFNISKSDLDSSVGGGECPGAGNVSAGSSGSGSSGGRNDSGIGVDLHKKVTLQLNNLDSSYDESALKKFLVSLLKPITPIVSLVIDGTSSAKIEVPSPHFAKSVISQLHRKKIGRKRMLVAYCKETINDISTLGYQVAGLLKDVPFYTLPLHKFRELFQARFKASISVLELYKMVDVCHIRTDENEEKHIHLNQAFLAKIEDSPFNPNLQHSIPYCARHFRRENYKGWAEQELEPLPNVFLTIGQVQNIVYRLMQTHTDGIPVASILHCIEACLNIAVSANDNGISLEHLLSCVKGVQIENNVYGIKIIGLTKQGKDTAGTSPPGGDIYDAGDSLFYTSNSYTLTPAQALSKEVIELLKICPKATMNFSKFVPAYHNYFGKQCRVADYGYTKLIELFEGMSSIIQVLGEGNNRYITLTHRIQVRRFANDLMKTIKWQVNKSVLLSKLPHLLAFTLNHTFSITDYGVCSLNDMLEELESTGVITMDRVVLGTASDVLISLPKHKQTRHEIDKTFVFAGEIVELLRQLPHFEILFQKFVKSYFYHFGYHCRLSDYGFQKLAELFETIEGLVTLDPINDENRKLSLSPLVARRIFSEQLNALVAMYSRRKGIRVPLVDVVNLFRNKFGYSMIPQTLGCNTIEEMMRCLPFIEINESGKDFFIICHGADEEFRKKSLMVCLLFIHLGTDSILYSEFFPWFYQKFNEYLTESYILAMKHVIEIHVSNGIQIVVLSELIKFILWIVCQLDTKSKTGIKTLKSQMNVQINTCFPLGYPNMSSLLASFPEIFTLHGKEHENAEVSLNPQFFIAKPEIQKYFQILKKQADQLVPPTNYFQQDAQATSYLPPDSEYLGVSAMNSFYSQPQPQKLTQLPPPPTSGHFNFNSNSVTALDDKIFGASQSSRIVPGDVGAAAITTAKAVSKIKGVKRDFIPLTIRSNFYEPPKPDTPPSKLWPFGYDPVWSEDVSSPPPIDELPFKLPKMSPAKFPVLQTPPHLKVTSTVLFDFDAAYREMISRSD